MSIVELDQELRLSIPKVTLTSYEEYIDRGGVLDFESYRKLESCDILNIEYSSPESIEKSRAQAHSMATFADIQLTDREVNMYILLRTLPLDTRDSSGQIVEPLQMSDQVLLSEILRFTKSFEHEKFVKKYNNIFTTE
jgi:hypothetical protein